MDPGNDQWRVEEAEQRGANRRKATGHQVAHGKGDAVADHAAKRTDKGVSEEHRQNQGADRYHHQIEVVRHDAFQARFDKAERQTRQQRRDDLRLVADLRNRKQAEVPHFRHLLAQ